MNGWAQWGSNPGNKLHYFIEDEPGHHLSACEQYGLINTQRAFIEDPPVRKRCKLCLNRLPTSGGTE